MVFFHRFYTLHHNGGKRLLQRLQSTNIAPLRAAGRAEQYSIGHLATSCELVKMGVLLNACELIGNATQQIYDIMRPKL